MYPERFEVFLQDEALEFTPKEFELLIYLLENKNRVLTRDQLLSAVWKYDFAGDTRIVDVHISHLRDKIEENSRKPMFIKQLEVLVINLRSRKRHEIDEQPLILDIHAFTWNDTSCPNDCYRSAFPVYIEQYNEQATTEIRTSMDQVIDERKMDLTKEDQEALYAAQAMERDESLLNYVRARLYGVLAILFTITLILIAIISRYMIRNFTAPIDNVTDTALELAKGNYRARAQENEHERMIPLSHSINILARNLQDITTIREVEEERLKTLIENMGSSL